MICIDIYIHIYKNIYMEKGKAEAQGSKTPHGAHSEMAQAGREAEAFSGTAVLYLDLYICKAIYQPSELQSPTPGS